MDNTDQTRYLLDMISIDPFSIIETKIVFRLKYRAIYNDGVIKIGYFVGWIEDVLIDDDKRLCIVFESLKRSLKIPESRIISLESTEKRLGSITDLRLSEIEAQLEILRKNLDAKRYIDS